MATSPRKALSADEAARVRASMARLRSGPGPIVMHPESAKQLSAAGIPVPTHTTVDTKTYVDGLAKTCLEGAYERAGVLPNPPHGAQPEIVAMWQEARHCAIFKQYGAAVTLISILVEYVLKHAAYVKEMGGFKYNPLRWDAYEKMDFSNAVGQASKMRLLSKSQRKRLDAFRDQVRNPYAHFNVRKITKHSPKLKVRALDLRTQEVTETEVVAADTPMVQASAKAVLDAKLVPPAFAFAEEMITYLLAQIASA